MVRCVSSYCMGGGRGHRRGLEEGVGRHYVSTLNVHTPKWESKTTSHIIMHQKPKLLISVKDILSTDILV